MRALNTVLRMAARDAREIMGRGAYLLAAAGPLLLMLFLGGLLIIAALFLSAIHIAELESSPLGTGRAALVLAEDVGPEGKAIAQALLSEKAFEDSSVVGWAGRAKSYLRALKGEEETKGLSTEKPMGTPLDLTQVKAEAPLEIPGEFDAALRIFKGSEGQLLYEVDSDKAILYSRVMGQKLEGAVGRLNSQSNDSGTLNLDIEDRRDERVDPWSIYALLLFISIGIAYTYHGIAVQSVASLLAGERENRTLDVLLALPVTREELVWGKLLALVIAILMPTAIWVIALSLLVATQLGVYASVLSLLMVDLAIVIPLTAVGCAISATAPSIMAAQNRLGMANLMVFVGGLSALFLLRGAGIGNETLLGALVLAAQGQAWLWVLGLLAGSLFSAGVLVKVAAKGLRV